MLTAGAAITVAPSIAARRTFLSLLMDHSFVFVIDENSP